MSSTDTSAYDKSQPLIPVTPDEWDARFSETPDEWYFGRDPSDLARLTYGYWKTLQPELPAHVLDFGCGEGRDAVFFSQKGFEVTAVDGSHVALAKLNRLANENIAHIASVQQVELDSFPITSQYSVVSAHNSLQFIGKKMPGTIRHMKAIAPSGAFHAISGFSDEAEVTHDNPDLYVLKRGELKQMYSDWFVLYYSEEILWREPSQNFFSFAKIIAHKP
ncbi:MAG: methyltransferase domain-containing protein [Chthonomonadales bacterium]